MIFVDIGNMEVVKRVNELQIEGEEDQNESWFCVGGKGRRIEIGIKVVGVGFAIFSYLYSSYLFGLYLENKRLPICNQEMHQVYNFYFVIV